MKEVTTILLPSKEISNTEHIGMCNEAMCDRTPTRFVLFVDLEGLPFNLYTPLCDQHAREWDEAICDG